MVMVIVVVVTFVVDIVQVLEGQVALQCPRDFAAVVVVSVEVFWVGERHRRMLLSFLLVLYLIAPCVLLLPRRAKPAT